VAVLGTSEVVSNTWQTSRLMWLLVCLNSVQMAGAVLPTAHESQMVDATTSASIVVVRDLRHGLTLLT
jgi:hypothetical protein